MLSALFRVGVGVSLLSLPLLCVASTVAGKIDLLDQPISDAKITLWKTNGKDAPSQISSLNSDKQGQFSFALSGSNDPSEVYYLTSDGGMVNGKRAGSLSLMAVLGNQEFKQVVLNELTTVGSVWPNAQLLDGTRLKGSLIGLKIGSANVPNLVDVSTGHYGDVILDGSNINDSETMSRMNTLASLVATCGDPAKASGCSQFVKLADSDNTLSALQNIARRPWNNADKLYDVFTTNYPVSITTKLRSGAVFPYLLFAPTDFSLILRFTGGGLLAPGKILFDKEGNLWTGFNWMSGSESGVVNNLGGALAKFSSGGKPLSPAPLGFNGQDINGVGWGTGMSEDKVWVGTFNKTVGVFDLHGNPLGPVTFGPEIGELQGFGTAGNGDVWVADNTKNHMIRFPKGDHTKPEVVVIPGLTNPFGVAVDQQNRVWVTSSEGNKLTIFSGDNPKDVHQIPIAIGQRGVAIDSKGNAWVAEQSDYLKYPWWYTLFIRSNKPKSIMQEFKQGLEYLEKHTSTKDPIGLIALITPDLKLVDWEIGKDTGIYVPWGVSIDGADLVWVADFYGSGIVQMCGADTSVCPEGKKTGDVIHLYQSGVFQKMTDNIIDPAGNVWTANNWHMPDALVNDKPMGPLSTKGGGNGINVIYGVASPVASPLIGPARKP